MKVTDKLNPFQLASLVDCYSPDTLDSPGGAWLTVVYEAAIEAFERVADEELHDFDWSDAAHEIADQHCDDSDGTYNMWQRFVDLGAFNEDPSELGADSGDMNKLAMTCLYMIAERVCTLSFDEWTRLAAAPA
jgi:hypothetical protein